MDVQMTLAVFKLSDAIYFVSFVQSFKTGCDSDGIDKGAAMSLSHHFMKDSTSAAPVHRVWAMETENL